MRISEAGLARIKRYEACSLTVYDDQAGLPTIGWGHLIKPGEFASDARLTQTEADALFAKDVAWVEEALARSIRVAVSQDAYDSLAALCFNIGATEFVKSTVVRRVNAKADNAAIREALCWWDKVTDKQTGTKVRSEGLAKRRADEARAWP